MDPRVTLSFSERRYNYRYDRDVIEENLTWDDIQQLAANRRTLDARLAEIELHLQTGNHAAAKTALAGAREQAAPLANFVQVVEDLVPVHKRPPTAASALKAQEVFSTPELLEMILLELDNREKFKVMAVQRCWRDTLLGSVALKKTLGLVPQTSKSYFSAFSRHFLSDLTGSGGILNLPGGNNYDDREPRFEWDEDSEASFDNDSTPTRDDPYVLNVEVDIYKQQRRIGTLVRQMLLCSPGILSLQAEIYCSCDTTSQSEDEDYTEKINLGIVRSSSSLGFSVGELADKTAELLATHSDCDCRHITYTAAVPLDDNDPILLRRLRYHNFCEQKKEVRQQWRAQQAAAGVSVYVRDFHRYGSYSEMGYIEDPFSYRLKPLPTSSPRREDEDREEEGESDEFWEDEEVETGDEVEEARIVHEGGPYSDG